VSATTNITHDRSGGIDHRLAAAGTVVLAIASLVFANFVGTADDANGGVGEFVTTGALTLAVAAIVFGRVVPRALESGSEVRTALYLTALAVPAVMAFWAGITQIAAPAAILLAYLALKRPGSSRAGAWIAIALSTLAYLAAYTACVAG
jgi:hypothetical protein